MTSLHKLPLVAFAALLSVPASAQGEGAQSRASTPAAGPACTPEHAAMGHCKLAPAREATPPPQPAAPAACSPEHAAMGHCTHPAPAEATAQPRLPASSACSPDHAAMGHCTLPTTAPAPPPPTCTPEHAAMGHCTPPAAGAAEGTNLPAGAGLPPPVPTDRAADAIYGPAAMGMARHHLALHHGSQSFSMVMLNIAELKIKDGHDAYEWGGEAWYGGDINRLVVKTEGEGALDGGVESAEVQALYSRAIGPYFDLQAGLRYDFAPDPSRVYAAVGFEGLAPGFFDVEGTLFLSDRGELMGRLEGYYDQRITQRLILQPRAEMNFAAQDSADIGVGAGLSEAEIGLRLRYDIAREFAPYVGVQYERVFGKTRDFLRDEGEATGGWSFLAGIRAWF
jgi:copper resistance protein B